MPKSTQSIDIHITISTNGHSFLATPDVYYNPLLTFLSYSKMLFIKIGIHPIFSMV